MDCLPSDCKTIPLSKTFAFAYTGVSPCKGYLIIFWSDMTHTVVSSSPPLKILPLEYMVVLESN